ncbi:DUF3243 domain-containing protein [Thermoflavimicrobium daqui]|jgi:hypothetical protein|uniref:DUF3243 domain-containing protein n=1 Tax=Thermoflavimicrobium daqui TaxID=2137476 RepID=A0A364K7U4_9BACL|nr:DUF3243 domain-containing protein [Thermoflavimicrobium daqui]RAL26371.1 DUF3243 domain-containing protein [Thermoflavimicrobium daqui]
MSVLENFQEWKNFLSERVNQAQGLGMDQNTISDLAYQLGDYLAKDVDPKNEQERLLQELWSVASEEEQKTIAGLMVKMVNDGKK